MRNSMVTGLSTKGHNDVPAKSFFKDEAGSMQKDSSLELIKPNGKKA
jgi:hypothetical protein